MEEKKIQEHARVAFDTEVTGKVQKYKHFSVRPTSWKSLFL